jgi:hypothetical protein
MSLAHADSLLALNARLRTMFASIEGAMSCLLREGTPEAHRAATRELALAWAGLVDLLALGPAPEIRDCPTCHHVGMLAATRCGYCWAELAPPASPSRGMMQ